MSVILCPDNFLTYIEAAEEAAVEQQAQMKRRLPKNLVFHPGTATYGPRHNI